MWNDLRSCQSILDYYYQVWHKLINFVVGIMRSIFKHIHFRINFFLGHYIFLVRQFNLRFFFLEIPLLKILIYSLIAIKIFSSYKRQSYYYNSSKFRQIPTSISILGIHHRSFFFNLLDPFLSLLIGKTAVMYRYF